jgi:hypothetical protein
MILKCKSTALQANKTREGTKDLSIQGWVCFHRKPLGIFMENPQSSIHASNFYIYSISAMYIHIWRVSKHVNVEIIKCISISINVYK